MKTLRRLVEEYWVVTGVRMLLMFILVIVSGNLLWIIQHLIWSLGIVAIIFALSVFFEILEYVQWRRGLRSHKWHQV